MALALLLLLAGGNAPSAAQEQWDIQTLQPPSPSIEAQAGVTLVQRGQPAQALPFLRSAHTTAPVLVLPSDGAVAYWLGEAYAQTGDSARARTTWDDGLDRLREVGRFDVRLADAYLRTLSPARLRRERLRAVDVYQALLSHITDTTEALQPLFHRRVAQLVPLLPDDVFENVVQGPRDDPKEWTVRPGAGPHLLSWWRRLDPFADTPENERLEEHLTRLVHARRAFDCPTHPAGLDQRGIVHLRLGAPARRQELSYQDGKFFREVFRFGVHLPPDAFPDSELWTYPQIDASGYFLFAEGTHGCFNEARTSDLIPNTLTRQRSTSERGLNYAYSGLMAMRAIYAELALYHIDFANRYDEIANYAGAQEMAALRAEADARSEGSFPDGGDRQIRVGAGPTARTVTVNPTMGLEAPTRFVSRMASRAEREDAAAAREREKQVPRQYTALYDNVPRLPVAVRTARFLNDDGTTRTEVYWGLEGSGVRLPIDDENAPPAPSLIQFSATQYNGDHSEARRTSRRYPLPARPDSGHTVLVGSPLTFAGTSSLQHLSLQWTQHQRWQHADGSTAGLGPKRRFALVQADSLAPLRPSGPLEMSDLKVLSLPDTVDAAAPNLAARATPYPFRHISAQSPLLLSFEAYHLAYAPDDRTRYTVSYEVTGKTRRGWTRLFRGQDTQSTATATTMRSTSRRTDELILIDLSAIDRDEPQDVRVTVRLTDEVTGHTVSRSLDFVLVPSTP